MSKLWKSGDPFIWLTGGALALSLIMVVGLIVLVLVNGLGFFWPAELHRFDLKDGSSVLGQVVERQSIPHLKTAEGGEQYRILVKRGNRDLYGADFVWVDESQIVKRELPDNAIAIERIEWGNFYGFVLGPIDEKAIAREHEIIDQIKKIERKDVGKISRAQEKLRLEMKSLDAKGVKDGPEYKGLQQESAQWEKRYEEKLVEISELKKGLTGNLVAQDVMGKQKVLPLSQIVRFTHPNTMGFPAKLGFYFSKLWEFLWDEPRESNTEGGVFPAIFGTILMVMIMSLLVTPLGVLAAFYLREYAKQGPFVSAVRIAVNNLAGVPSIVFGVFGVGFFIYFIGGTIDKIFYPESLPSPTFGTGGILWASLTLALLTVPVVIVATEEGLAAIPRGMREASLALGATKFETTWRVVLPAVMPSVLTGLILAMARAAGEVAPLMITGVVKLAPSLAVDGIFPFLHLDRKFMHLGHHIYDVGFQSPNVDAARPMVFTTTLLLLVIVLVLNFGAILLRNRLKKKFASSAV